MAALAIKAHDALQRVADLSSEATNRKSPSPASSIHDVDILLLDEPTRGIDVLPKGKRRDL